MLDGVRITFLSMPNEGQFLEGSQENSWLTRVFYTRRPQRLCGSGWSYYMFANGGLDIRQTEDCGDAWQVSAVLKN
jgi:hypothetical protein